MRRTRLGEEVSQETVMAVVTGDREVMDDTVSQGSLLAAVREGMKWFEVSQYKLRSIGMYSRATRAAIA